MDNFLRASSASGQKLTGENSFTLAPDAIWSRLQQVLPKNEYWILKLVQAVVSWGGKRIDFEADDERLCATCELPGPLPEPQNFWSTDILSGPYYHLRVAVATLSARKDAQGLSLDWLSPQRNVRFHWVGQTPQVEEQNVTEQSGSSIRLTLTANEGSWLGQLFRGDPFYAEWQALKDRHCLESIEILVNGEPLPAKEPNSALYRPLLAQDSTEAFRVFYYFQRSLVLPRYLDWMKSSKYKDKRGDYGSRLMPVTTTTFHWVFDGVVVDRWRRDSAETAVAAEVYLSADGLELDLSGFAVSPSDEAEKRIESTRSVQLELLAETEVDLPQKLQHSTHLSKANKSVWGMDLFVGVLFPPYLLLGLVELVRLPRTAKRLLQTDLSLCREHIQRRKALLEETR